MFDLLHLRVLTLLLAGREKLKAEMKTRNMRAEYESGNENVLNLIANQCFDYQNAHTSRLKICVRLVQISF